jgi:hypothetical protein
MLTTTNFTLQSRLKILLCLLLFAESNQKLKALDWRYYITHYPELKSLGVNNGISALVHFLEKGFIEERQAAAPIPNTNFDWHYYKRVNYLQHIFSEQQAVKHYKNVGKKAQLSYCKPFKIGILLHLYNLDLVDEFIEKINYFLSINSTNDFSIKIAVPVDKNIDNYKAPLIKEDNEDLLFNEIVEATPYHKNLINQQNFKKLYTLSTYLKNNLHLPKDKIQVMFCENRGLDIGSFFLMIDQIIKEKSNYDFIIKLHSKTYNNWRHILTSFLNLRLNKLLRTKSFIYTCDLNFTWHGSKDDNNIKIVRRLLSYYKKPELPFRFCGGTMFIMSHEIIDFFKKYNLLTLFNTLNVYESHPTKEEIEHGYERFFGYLATYFKLNHQVVGCVAREDDHLLKEYGNE